MTGLRLYLRRRRASRAAWLARELEAATAGDSVAPLWPAAAYRQRLRPLEGESAPRERRQAGA